MFIATCCDFEPRSWRGVLDATLCDQVYQRLATGWRFSQSTPVSSTIKTDHHDIAEILLKVVLNTIKLKKNVSHIMAFNELLWLDRLQFSWKKMSHCFSWILDLTKVKLILLYPRSPKGEGGILFYLCPSVQDIFRRIFLSNCWWQKSDIWSQVSYRYTILWVAFLDPSDSYFLFADLVGFYTH